MSVPTMVASEDVGGKRQDILHRRAAAREEYARIQPMEQVHLVEFRADYGEELTKSGVDHGV